MPVVPMCTSMTDANNPWEQFYIAYFRDIGEIPLNLDDEPNPAEWTKVKKPKKGVSDWIDYAVNRTTLRKFSIQTKTYYDIERAPFRTPTVETDK